EIRSSGPLYHGWTGRPAAGAGHGDRIRRARLLEVADRVPPLSWDVDPVCSRVSPLVRLAVTASACEWFQEPRSFFKAAWRTGSEVTKTLGSALTSTSGATPS